MHQTLWKYHWILYAKDSVSPTILLTGRPAILFFDSGMVGIMSALTLHEISYNTSMAKLVLSKVLNSTDFKYYFKHVHNNLFGLLVICLFLPLCGIVQTWLKPCLLVCGLGDWALWSSEWQWAAYGPQQSKWLLVDRRSLPRWCWQTGWSRWWSLQHPPDKSPPRTTPGILVPTAIQTKDYFKEKT